jgi:hypothetical protein
VQPVVTIVPVPLSDDGPAGGVDKQFKIDKQFGPAGAVLLIWIGET